jgi:hypothetical protein
VVSLTHVLALWLAGSIPISLLVGGMLRSDPR